MISVIAVQRRKFTEGIFQRGKYKRIDSLKKKALAQQ